MALNENALKNIFQNIIKKYPSEKGCPNASLLFEVAIGKLPEKKRLKVMDHISECNSCLQKFKTMRNFNEESKNIIREKEEISFTREEVNELKQKGMEIVRELEKNFKEKKKGRLKKRSTILFLPKLPLKYVSTAAVLLVITIGVLLIFRPSQDFKKDDYRGKDKNIVHLISPKGVIKKTEITFKWKHFENAEAYLIVLYDGELSSIWISPKTKNITMKLPADMSKKIEKEKIYYWKVMVFLKNGVTKKSKLQLIELKD